MNEHLQRYYDLVAETERLRQALFVTTPLTLKTAERLSEQIAALLSQKHQATIQFGEADPLPLHTQLKLYTEATTANDESEVITLHFWGEKWRFAFTTGAHAHGCIQCHILTYPGAIVISGYQERSMREMECVHLILEEKAA